MKRGLSYWKLFALPELQTSQTFYIHVYVHWPQTELREMKEAKSR